MKCRYGLPCDDPAHAALNALLKEFFSVKDRSTDAALEKYEEIEREKRRLRAVAGQIELVDGRVAS